MQEKTAIYEKIDAIYSNQKEDPFAKLVVEEFSYNLESFSDLKKQKTFLEFIDFLKDDCLQWDLHPVMEFIRKKTKESFEKNFIFKNRKKEI